MKGLDDYIMGIHQTREDSVKHICPKCKAEKYIQMLFDMGGWFYHDDDAPYCEKCKCEMIIAETESPQRQVTPGLCTVNGEEAMRHFPVEDY